MDPSRLLAPRSIAVVGASDREGAYADLVLRNLELSGFPGEVWGVNPKRDEVHGRTCFPSVAELPEPADAVVVAIPAPGVPAAVEQAGASGCGGAIVISAGFAEIDAGRNLQEQLREAALRHDLPVCGPNGNGIIAVGSKAPMWGDALEPFEPGPVAMISQSGNVAVNALGTRRGLRFHTVVSTGNQAVMDASDWLLALAAADDVRSVAMFLEGDGDGPGWPRHWPRAPTPESASQCSRSARRRPGPLRQQPTPRPWPETSASSGPWSRRRVPPGPATRTSCWSWPRRWPSRARGSAPARGSPCSPARAGTPGIAGDEAERLGVPLPPLSEETAGELEKLLPAEATIANPLDYTALIWGDVEKLREIIRVVGADPAIEQLLVLYDQPQNLFGPGADSWDDVRAGIIAGAEATEASVLVSSTLPDLIDDDACEQFAARGVAPLSGIHTALSVAAALRRPHGDPARHARDRGGDARPAPDAARGGRVARRGRGQGAAGRGRDRGPAWDRRRRTPTPRSPRWTSCRRRWR